MPLCSDKGRHRLTGQAPITLRFKSFSLPDVAANPDLVRNLTTSISRRHYLLTHPGVNDCVVIGVPSDREGEVPKAFVVKAPGAIEDSDQILKRDIAKHVEKVKSNHKWLRGGIEFIDVVPKSASGKILRRMLRDKEKEKRQKQGAKL